MPDNSDIYHLHFQFLEYECRIIRIFRVSTPRKYGPPARLSAIPRRACTTTIANSPPSSDDEEIWRRRCRPSRSWLPYLPRAGDASPADMWSGDGEEAGMQMSLRAPAFEGQKWGWHQQPSSGVDLYRIRFASFSFYSLKFIKKLGLNERVVYLNLSVQKN